MTLLGEGLWYWGLFALAALLILAVPVCWWLEDRAEEREREAWDAWQRGERP